MCQVHCTSAFTKDLNVYIILFLYCVLLDGLLFCMLTHISSCVAVTAFTVKFVYNYVTV